ncbi:hypothetical protein Tbd_0631 [Thiobacillus denitrificans ATCC 25259]|uniref:Uncharacterized protein n=1 Tax=Thiobacillus denitrificans (strain ATCC 25259 / T1) TaxID=292415 RepID=Q3SL35_THIDA|nr:hypothetical protein [Thiobacillus denitrificans]AAZ96584.1 hypothetical protein Tbd_0631 [Thiobacillus denitrificans ATCC 25259]
MTPPAPRPPKRRALIASIAINVVLALLAGGLVLYAFMLNVDLGDVKRRLSKEVETRQQTERYLIETRNKLTESVREIEQLKAQLAYKESDYQAGIAVKPALPVVVGFRSSMLGKGLVAVLENTSDRYLTVMLSARNPTLAQAKRFQLDLEPRSRVDFGHFEGWEFASGDEIALFRDEFRPIRLTVP